VHLTANFSAGHPHKVAVTIADATLTDALTTSNASISVYAAIIRT
jgi:hypothetical protein